MEEISSHRMTPDQILKNKRALENAALSLDNERARMEQQEKKIIADIKKMAKEGQKDAAKMMAKDLKSSLTNSHKLLVATVNIRSISAIIHALRSQSALSQAMGGVSKELQSLYRQLKLPQIQKTLQEFEKEYEIKGIKKEIVNDAMDDALGDEDDEEPSVAIVTQILNEIDLRLKNQQVCLPSTSGNVANPSPREPVAPCLMIRGHVLHLEGFIRPGMTPVAMLRKNKLALKKVVSDLDGERAFMEGQIEKSIDDFKSVKEGQIEVLKVSAKNIVWMRAHLKTIMMVRTHIKAVLMNDQTLYTLTGMEEAMRGVTKVMQKMSRELRSSSIYKILHEFEKQSDMVDMKEGMTNDAIDDALEDEDDEEKTDAVVTQILNELGLRLKVPLPGLPLASANLAKPCKRVPVPVVTDPVSDYVRDTEEWLDRIKLEFPFVFTKD